jgi:hypothetical protein
MGLSFHSGNEVFQVGEWYLEPERSNLAGKGRLLSDGEGDTDIYVHPR